MKLGKGTLVYVFKDGKVLLGRKKRGFGKDKWNGFGGKVEEKETFGEAAVRELREECNLKIKLKDLIWAAKLMFQFPQDKNDLKMNEVVQIYRVDWREDMGVEEETEEMEPRWFDITDIPYDLMWESDRSWFKRFLRGEKFEAQFLYKNCGDGKETVEREVYKKLKV